MKNAGIFKPKRSRKDTTLYETERLIRNQGHTEIRNVRSQNITNRLHMVIIIQLHVTTHISRSDG